MQEGPTCKLAFLFTSVRLGCSISFRNEPERHEFFYFDRIDFQNMGTYVYSRYQRDFESIPFETNIPKDTVLLVQITKVYERVCHWSFFRSANNLLDYICRSDISWSFALFMPLILS